MKDEDKTKDQLLDELIQVRLRNAELENMLKGWEEEPQNSGEFHRLVLSSISDAVFMTDKNGVFTYICPNVDVIFGYTIGEVKSFGTITKLLGNDTVISYALKHLEEMRNIDQEIIDKFGRVHSLLINIKRVSIKKSFLLFVCRDITERKEAEEKITRTCYIQGRINSFLHSSLKEISLEKQLDHALDLIFSLPSWLSYEQKGAIYLVEDDPDSLVLKTQQGFSESELSVGSKVSFNRFLCHETISINEIFFTQCEQMCCRTSEHDRSPYTNYCVPIVSKDKLLGIICLCVMDGYERDQGEDDFVTTVASTLAGIIERKRAEEALRQSEERLQLVVQNMPVMMDAFDEEGNIIVWNNECERVTGYSARVIIGNKKALELLYPHEEYRKNMLNQWNEQGDEYYNWEWDVTCKDGTVKTIAWSNISGKFSISGWASWGIGVDITGLKETKKALKRERDIVQMYLDIAGVIFIVIDRNQKVVLINQKGCDVLGYSEKEIIGKNWFEHFLPEHARQEVLTVYELLMEGKVDILEYHENSVLTSNGEERIIAWHNTFIKNENGQVEAVLRSGEDITKRKQTERKLKASQSQLIQAEKMCALGTLVAGISHELNNPLMGLINYIQYCLKKTSLDDKKFPVLQDAERAAKRCIDIVNNLLTFSHMEKVSDEVFTKESITKPLEDVLRLLSYRIEKENVTVIKDYGQSIPHVTMRVNSIQQVFLNIVINALDVLIQCEEKEIHIYIRRDGDFVSVAVEDTGPGIAPDIIQRIFDPFFTTKPTGQGTGLGLSICHSIIEMHGGWITGANKPGQGARFEIIVPLQGKNEMREENE